MINLLSPAAQKANAAIYRSRFFIIALILALCALGVGMGLLVPSFILSRGMLESAREHADIAERSIALRERETAAAALAESRERLAILDESRAGVSARDTIAAVIGVRDTISLVGIYAETSAERTTIRVTGIAPTRDDLLSFVSRTRALPSVAEANLPVSDLTTVKDIDFSISIVATP